MMQKIIVLGSTGSVGKSSLEVIEQNKKYVAKCLVASKNSDLINQQSKIHKKAKYSKINNIQDIFEFEMFLKKQNREAPFA